MKSITPLILCATLILPACGPAPVASGSWRATLDLPGGELPFTLLLDETGAAWSATVVNGEERVRVPRVTVTDDRLELVFPAYNTRIDARREGAGYSGELTLVKRGGNRQVIPFNARPGNDHRFFETRADNYANIAGRWEVTFMDADGAESQAIAEFSQQEHRVQGTFLTPTGDYRFLDGEMAGDTLFLSTFDGSHAFLFHARLVGDTLQGDFWSGSAWHESWTARPNDNAALPDANSLTALIGNRFEFAFPDTTGRSVSLDDPRFQDKVVVVAMAGSWCPNCHDEAAFLAPLYEKYREQGLEIVGLMFEHLDDFDEAARQVDAFRDKFDIQYPLLVAGSSDKRRAAETMSMLDRVYAFPTSIFIDRSGAVRRIHTGFSGPGTGQHYQTLVTEFTSTIEQLLQE